MRPTGHKQKQHEHRTPSGGGKVKVTTWDVEKYAGTFCGDEIKGKLCGKRQFESPGGLTCDDGHGGAPELDAPPATGTPLNVKEQPPGDPFASASAIRGDAVPELPKIPDMRRGFEGVVRRIYDDGMDVEVAYEEIEASLRIDGALSPGAIQQFANNAETNAHRAFKLFVIAKAECDGYIRETEPIVGAMREIATAQLQHEKETGQRNKAITDADVLGRVASLYPDEWTSVNRRRDRAKGMLKMIDNLSGLARGRSWTLSAMATGKRPVT